MDRARANDDQETTVRVGILYTGNTLVAARQDGRLAACGLGNLVLKEIGWCEWVVSLD